MADLLSMWWVHTVIIERYTGDGAEGPEYAAAETVKGFVDDSVKLVRSDTGKETVSSRRVFVPLTVAPIPAGSRVTYGAKTSTAINVADRDGGGLPLPEHREVSCE